MVIFNSYVKLPEGSVPFNSKLYSPGLRCTSLKSRRGIPFLGIPCIHNYSQWIGLRENLHETIDFPIKYGAFL